MRPRGSAGIRIAILTEIPAPYRIPLFNALASQEGIDLTVLFLRRRNPQRPYQLHSDEFAFAWRLIPGRDWTVGRRWLVVNRGVRAELQRVDPDLAIVGGWNQPAFWQALAYARRRRRPLVAWVESTSRDVRSRSRGAELAKRVFLRAPAAFVVPGRASLEYLRSLGVAADAIAIAPNAVDLDIFGTGTALARRDRDAIRAELGFRRCTFLYVGRLAPEKGLDLLMNAAAHISADVAIVGTGTEESRLRSIGPRNVRFVGRHLERAELVRWYAAADAFVLPSRSEPWALVLNEAVAAGLPLVATEAAGGAYDLIEDGINGIRVPVGDEEALAAAMRRLAEDDAFRAAAGARSLEVSNRFTPEAWAEAVAGLARRLVG